MMSSKTRVAVIVSVFFALFSVSAVTVMADNLNEQVSAQTQQTQQEGKIEEKIGEKLVSLLGASEQPVIVGEGKPYTLGKEDILQITVRNQAEFSGQYVIGPDGKIQYTFVGDIEAEGLTKGQLKEKLIKELERFVKVPEVSIAITAYNSKNVYILGEVARPGKYPMRGDIISLRDAIMAAGLPTRQAALRKVHIIKTNEEGATLKKVNVYALLYKGKLEDNIDLVSGDVVVVPSTFSSKLNRALGTILSPVTQGAAARGLF